MGTHCTFCNLKEPWIINRWKMLSTYLRSIHSLEFWMNSETHQQQEKKNKQTNTKPWRISLNKYCTHCSSRILVSGDWFWSAAFAVAWHCYCKRLSALSPSSFSLLNTSSFVSAETSVGSSVDLCQFKGVVSLYCRSGCLCRKVWVATEIVHHGLKGRRK